MTQTACKQDRTALRSPGSPIFLNFRPIPHLRACSQAIITRAKNANWNCGHPSFRGLFTLSSKYKVSRFSLRHPAEERFCLESFLVCTKSFASLYLTKLAFLASNYAKYRRRTTAHMLKKSYQKETLCSVAAVILE